MNRQITTLALPNDVTRPYFAYGLFKPGELAHRQVADFLDGVPVPDCVAGTLWARDGLPLLEPQAGSSVVKGTILNFRAGSSAYRVVCDFEPPKHYEWSTCTTQKRTEVSVLVGRLPKQGAILLEEGVWTGRSDPMLVKATELVKEFVDRFADGKFDPAPPESFDWKRFFELQMAYLLLWTSIERYCSLAFGPALMPMAKVHCFGKDPAFRESLANIVSRTDVVYDSRDPEKSESLDPSNGPDSVLYYYQVRSNLSHRGKAAWKDGELLRNSLRELTEVFADVLKNTMVA